MYAFRREQQALDDLLDRLTERYQSESLSTRARQSMEWDIRWLLGVRSAYVSAHDWAKDSRGSRDQIPDGPDQLDAALTGASLPRRASTTSTTDDTLHREPPSATAEPSESSSSSESSSASPVPSPPPSGPATGGTGDRVTRQPAEGSSLDEFVDGWRASRVRTRRRADRCPLCQGSGSQRDLRTHVARGKTDGHLRRAEAAIDAMGALAQLSRLSADGEIILQVEHLDYLLRTRYPALPSVTAALADLSSDEGRH